MNKYILLLLGIIVVYFLFIKKDNVCKKLGGIYYINLKHRIDRKKQIEEEIKKLGCPFQRIDAVKNKNGGLGCVRSHIKCLELAKKKNLQNILILEDDFVFVENNNNVRNKISNALKLLKNNWDVIMLSGNILKTENSIYDDLDKVIDVQTASGYIVNNHYYDTLINNFKEAEKHLANDEDYTKWALDQYWKILQPDGNWFIMNPTIGKQKESYSDIENTVVNYQV